MKTAILTVETISASCPHCEGMVVHPQTGTDFWTVGELQCADVARCQDCGAEVRLPKTKSVRLTR